MDIIARSLMIGQFDPTPVKDFLESLPLGDWNEFTQRQDQFDAHKATNTIAAIFPDRSCLLYTSPSPRDRQKSRMPSSA